MADSEDRKMGVTPRLRVTALPKLVPKSATTPPAHHIGSPPTAFKNPWPSFKSAHSVSSAISTRFGKTRNFVPVPVTREELVPVQKPNFEKNHQRGLKLVWIGHASFFIETTPAKTSPRGIRLLIDPVWSEQVGPYGVVGPKRFSPTPCTLNEVPQIDGIIISHNHYDHLDISTVRHFCQTNPNLHIFCPLNLKSWFMGIGAGLEDDQVTELDWWEGVHVSVPDMGDIRVICTPSQHASRRSLFDGNCSLWSSWIIEEAEALGSEGSSALRTSGKKLFFAGDTAYREVESDEPDHVNSAPRCPAFAEIGELYGPFDIALLPIGCFLPRNYLSAVHCAPEDSVEIHKDIRSKRSIGMHYGTIRGGLSAQYEDVREPPRRFKRAAEQAGLRWGEEIGLCDIGEVVIV